MQQHDVSWEKSSIYDNDFETNRNENTMSK